MRRLGLLIDGGCLRVWARGAGRDYDADLVEQVAKACVGADEELFRAILYECPPFVGTVTLPISGGSREFSGSDRWLDDVGRRDFFAVRRGTLKFRGWEPKVAGVAATDADFKPNFEQKGVDMQLGLDIASFSANKAVDRIAVLTADTDLIPAFQYARQAGLQVVLIGLDPISRKQSDELTAQVDLHRVVRWP